MTRFLADENVSRHVVERLRAAGFDVTTAGSTDSGATDIEVLARAFREGRILITEDRDFGELVIRQRLGSRGIVLLELDQATNAAEADRVLMVVSANADSLPGNLTVIELEGETSPATIAQRPR